MEEAPTEDPLEVPLPASLRPYLALQTEPAGAPGGARFEGWWVSAWQSALPCLQIDQARSLPVGRAMRLARDCDPDATAAAIGDAALFVTTETEHLATAAARGVPTVYVPDGPATAPLPGELEAIAPARRRVVRSHSAFRRDVPLAWIHRAVEELVPGALRAEASESSKCRERLRPFLRGRIADLGHGGHKILPAAVGVDFFRFDPTDWIGDVRDLWFFEDQSFDTVYSSHCLEDLWHPHQALEEWTRVLAPGGHLVLYLPLRDFYPNVGTPGANPGHKDDYVPEDVEGFLRDLGHMAVVRAARREDELSFEVVATKKAGRSWFVQRHARPAPEVSVLVVAESSLRPRCDATGLLATVEATRQSLGDTPHEILGLLRGRPPADHLAAVRDLAARYPECVILEDLAPRPYGERLEMLRRVARGRTLIVLAAGGLPLGGALRTLHDTIGAGAAAALPTPLDPIGGVLDADVAAGACLALDADAWPIGALRDTPYHTPLLWRAVVADLAGRGLAVRDVGGAEVVTAGLAGLPLPGPGLGMLTFDDQLRARGVAATPAGDTGPRRTLVVALRTLGDCILMTPAIRALAGAVPARALTIVTEQQYAWIFERLPGVREVWTVPPLHEPLYWLEDQIVDHAVRRAPFDELVLLTDRLDNPTYHHSGCTLQQFYALQAGVPAAAEPAPRLALAPELGARIGGVLQGLGVRGEYAVLHTRAGWPEKSLPDSVAAALCDHLATRHGLAVVVVGGDGELVPHPMAVNLAGQLQLAETAAVVAGARVFVGPDSGPMHMASAFGVPTLALYCGSSLRVAPPRAAAAIAVQAPRSCALPCGASPCTQGCGFEGLRPADACALLDALLGGDPRREFAGTDPAVLLRGPEGPILIPQTAPPAGAALAPPMPAATAADAADAPWPAPHVALDGALDRALEPAATGRHQQRLLARRRPPASGARSDLRPAIGALLGAPPPGSALEVLFDLAHLARCCGLHDEALGALVLGMDRARMLVGGALGRARPAFRQIEDHLLADALGTAAAADPSLATADRVLERFTAATGRMPELAHLLAALATAAATPNPVPRHAPRLAAAFVATAAGATHPTAMVCARALDQLGDRAALDAMLTAHLERLPRGADAERAETQCRRGIARAQSATDLDAAYDDLVAALPDLTDAGQRDAAQRVLALLTPRLRSAAGAGAR